VLELDERVLTRLDVLDLCESFIWNRNTDRSEFREKICAERNKRPKHSRP